LTSIQRHRRILRWRCRAGYAGGVNQLSVWPPDRCGWHEAPGCPRRHT
jgi:hypothetical protein